MILHLAVLALSLYAISKASDFFIAIASAIGQRNRLPDYLIGSLIVGVGTSLPELITSLSALIERAPELVSPNVFGTVTANIFAGLGFSTLGLFVLVRSAGRTRLLTIKHALGSGGLNFHGVSPLESSLGIILLACFLSYYFCRDGVFSRFEAAFFLVGYILFLQTDLRQARRSAGAAATAGEPPDLEPARVGYPPLRLSRFFRDPNLRRYFTPHLAITLGLGLVLLLDPRHGATLGLSFYVLVVSFAVLLLLDASHARSWGGLEDAEELEDYRAGQLRTAGIVFTLLYLGVSLSALFLSGDLIVRSTVFLADWFGLSSTILAGSVIALGTSLPDIVVAVKVARSGRHQLLIGHIMHSNIFDVLLIMGLCGMIVPLPVAAGPALMTVEFALGANVILLAILHDNRVSFAEGAFLTMAYFGFLGLLYGSL